MPERRRSLYRIDYTRLILFVWFVWFVV